MWVEETTLLCKQMHLWGEHASVFKAPPAKLRCETGDPGVAGGWSCPYQVRMASLLQFLWKCFGELRGEGFVRLLCSEEGNECNTATCMLWGRLLTLQTAELFLLEQWHFQVAVTRGFLWPILLNDSDRCVESMFIIFVDDMKLGEKSIALVFKKVWRSKKSRLNLN